MENRDFLGRGWKFPIRVDKRSGKIAMSSMEDDIKEAVGIIINTHVGERVMRPSFGSRAMDYVFESNAAGFEQQIRNDLESALILCEPRIRDVAVTVSRSEEAAGVANIYVNYVVRSTNNYFNVVYPFYLMEGIEA